MRTLAFVLGLLMAPSPFAHEGHDHGEADKPLPVVDAAPRFEAASEAFELVGHLEGRVLILYLDDFASNAPVAKAILELEAGTQKSRGAEIEAGVYRLELADARPGRHALLFTVQAGETNDLLTANLEIHPPRPPATAGAAFDWRRLGWAGSILPVLGFWFWRRRGKVRKGHA